MSSRALSFAEIDQVSGGAPSDAWGAISVGLGLIGGSVALEIATTGVSTPLSAAGIGTGVALIHAGLIGLASGG